MALQTISVLQSAISTAIREQRILKNISALLNNNTSKPTNNFEYLWKVQCRACRITIVDTRYNSYQQVITDGDTRGDLLQLFALRRIKTNQNFLKLQ